MVKVTVTTRNGDTLVEETTNRARIRELEDAALSESSNVLRTEVTGGLRACERGPRDTAEGKGEGVAGASCHPGTEGGSVLGGRLWGQRSRT